MLRSMSEWEIAIRDGRGNVRHVTFYGVTTEEEARGAAMKFADRWGEAEILRVLHVDNAARTSLTGVVASP